MSIEKVKFFVDHNKNENGKHVIHRMTCEHLPSSRDREYMGKYKEATVALNHAVKSGFDPAEPCPFCCQDALS